jgi:hypothetical protein
MRINDFCERLYEKKDDRGPLSSVGVSKEMREFIQEQLAKANEEALRLKQDELERKEDKFIPYHQITCNKDCMALFSLGPSMSLLERKDQKGILPNDTDQQYMYFYGWSFLAFALFVVFAIYSSYPNIHDLFTMSGVLIVLFVTSYFLVKDMNVGV